jgi:hypothetical protein
VALQGVESSKLKEDGIIAASLIRAFHQDSRLQGLCDLAEAHPPRVLLVGTDVGAIRERARVIAATAGLHWLVSFDCTELVDRLEDEATQDRVRMLGPDVVAVVEADRAKSDIKSLLVRGVSYFDSRQVVFLLLIGRGDISDVVEHVSCVVDVAGGDEDLAMVLERGMVAHDLGGVELHIDERDCTHSGLRRLASHAVAAAFERGAERVELEDVVVAKRRVRHLRGTGSLFGCAHSS